MSQFVTEPSLLDHITTLHPHIIRFPGGSISDANTPGFYIVHSYYTLYLTNAYSCTRYANNDGPRKTIHHYDGNWGIIKE